MKLEIEKKEFSYDHKVYYFTFKIHSDEHNFIYLTGYLDFYGHFRITDSHSTEVRDLAQAIVYLALNEDRLVSEFKDYPEHKN